MDLYIEAMDAKLNSSKFLKLWQVAKRLSWFGKNIELISTGYRNIILLLAEKRNNLVHTGLSDITEDDINNLKFAIDTTLLWYFQNIKKLPILEHISNYYRLRDKNVKELGTIKDCINYLI